METSNPHPQPLPAGGTVGYAGRNMEWVGGASTCRRGHCEGRSAGCGVAPGPSSPILCQQGALWASGSVHQAGAKARSQNLLLYFLSPLLLRLQERTAEEPEVL